MNLLTMEWHGIPVLYAAAALVILAVAALLIGHFDEAAFNRRLSWNAARSPGVGEGKAASVRREIARIYGVEGSASELRMVRAKETINRRREREREYVEERDRLDGLWRELEDAFSGGVR